ncbi:Uncharacterized conserved protein, DUF2141 family [Polaribacter sp. KT25b]|uniref:DUF2141 domain-containing protein n=1 Tax=Polaribacter sp. KT25b TaxID=1855336 RepID=UPI00087A625F|nr:DUF2141 domain-containing protein [Polaribacter sp. KT25b]SDR86620.1 Uncharacterized conserved protein, DUF2141 family [Polaribacter sp. KT25b]
MKFLVAIIVTAVLFFSNKITAQENVSITATVVNVTSDEGKVSFALFDKENFRIKSLQSVLSEIKEGKSMVSFTDIPSGEYAIICFHDKNENNKMDFATNGMPLENYGASNNVMNFGPPKYEDAKFVVADKNVSLEIRF